MPIKIKLNSLPDAFPSNISFSNEKKHENKDIASSVALTELNRLTGLNNIKSIVREIDAFAQVQKLRSSFELNTESIVLHSIFKGNPGTGKTTVARILAKLYKELGLLQKGHLIEVERADLVGEYIGHTAQKTKEQIKHALGGVLFVDEAYSLCRGGEKDFGREAIDALVKAMEDYKTDFVLILAGYTDDMDHFLSSNTGLASRLPLQLEFPDYSCDELLRILKQMYVIRDYYIEMQAEDYLYIKLEQIKQQANKNFGNARTIRNIMEASLRNHALRIMEYSGKYTTEILKCITINDISKACDAILKTKAAVPQPLFNISDGCMNKQKNYYSA